MESTFEVLSHVPSMGFSDEWYLSASENHFWVQWRWRSICDLIEQIPHLKSTELRALDVGGGHGVLASSLEKRFGWTVDCAELNEKALRDGAVIRGRRLFYDLNEKQPAMVGKYDVVFLCDVIEHLEDPQTLVRSAWAHLKPGGVLIVNVPALSTLYSRYDEVVGHLRRYTTKSLSTEIVAAGGEVIVARYWGFSLLPIALVRKAMIRFISSAADVVRKGFDPPSAWVHSALRGLMWGETSLLRNPLLGTSVLLAARRCL